MSIDQLKYISGLLHYTTGYDDNWHIIKGQNNSLYIDGLKFALSVFQSENHQQEPDPNNVITAIKDELERVSK